MKIMPVSIKRRASVKQLVVRASDRTPPEILRFMQCVAVRLQSNKDYKVKRMSGASFEAERGPYKIYFRVFPHQGLQWAETKIIFSELAPRLHELDNIKDEILGKEAYGMFVFRPTLEPLAAYIIHCVDDNKRPVPRKESK